MAGSSVIEYRYYTRSVTNGGGLLCQKERKMTRKSPGGTPRSLHSLCWLDGEEKAPGKGSGGEVLRRANWIKKYQTL
jgi:hypothetical protein